MLPLPHHLVRFSSRLTRYYPPASLALRNFSMSSTNSDLETWAQERITALWSAPDESAFHSEFERTFAPSECTKLTVNKEEIDRENYKNELQKLRAPMVRADIEFNDIDILDSSGEDVCVCTSYI